MSNTKKRRRFTQCYIDNIEEVGTEGMWKAEFSLGDHGAAITVIGADMTEMVERAHVVLTAFNTPKDAGPCT